MGGGRWHLWKFVIYNWLTSSPDTEDDNSTLADEDRYITIVLNQPIANIQVVSLHDQLDARRMINVGVGQCQPQQLLSVGTKASSCTRKNV